MTLLRFVLIFTVPIIFALLLDVGTFPYRAAAHQEASELLYNMITADTEVRAAYIETVLAEDKIQLSRLLDWFFAGAIVVGAVIFTMIIPVTYSIKRTVDLLTTMVVGFCTAKIIFGFGGMDWPDFAIWMGLGLAGALTITAIRNVSDEQNIDA